MNSSEISTGAAQAPMAQAAQNNPLVSIQMCTYNRANFLAQAIESVRAQTYTNWELLILDDASTDNTHEILQPFLSDSRIRYIRNEQNLGITKNRNKGLSLSTGRYIAVLDSDDYWLDTTKLAQQIAFLEAHHDYALVGTQMLIVNETDRSQKVTHYETTDPAIRNRLLIKNQFCHSSVVYHKNIADALHGYDTTLMIWEDYDLWLHMGQSYKFANLTLVGTAYRKHTQQSDTTKRKAALRSLSVIIDRYKANYPYYYIARIVQFLRVVRG